MNKKIIFGILILILIGLILFLIFKPTKSNLSKEDTFLPTDESLEPDTQEPLGNENHPVISNATLGSFCRGVDEGKTIQDSQNPERTLICKVTGTGNQRIWQEAE